MKKHLLYSMLLATMVPLGGQAQRVMDKIDRGLVAVKTANGVFCSWRIFGEEYYDVSYNLYRNGTKVNDKPLTVSNFVDTNGADGNEYTVAPVVRGVEKAQSKSVKVWVNNYFDIQLQPVYDADGNDITSVYEPNDVSVADVDGDGVQEILLKRRNRTDGGGSDVKNFDRIEVYKMDGTRLWWIDCGPNLHSMSSVEVNVNAYDWDQDGKAEVIFRAADGTVLHMADGTTQTIGDASKAYRPCGDFTHEGDEFLLYLNGETGKPYQVMDYPLKRLEEGETDLNAVWGDAYGHRSSKYFFGAPYLDGRKPSIFLARGIYTQIKMIAYDVNPQTHELVKRWDWKQTKKGSPWYGQGYHNFSVADVDWDGRDEIVYGSMVIDDNGQGLSTTGLGHGDSHHVGDFDPYNHGQEIFACNEDKPGNNLRDATTSKIYYRWTTGSDVGRAIIANVTDEFPGYQAYSSADGWISSVSHKTLDRSGGMDMNYRVYWDGDLLEETFNYNGWDTGSNKEKGNPRVYKYGKGAIFSFADSKTCNGTKGTPCFQGDILGDWREEYILRTDDGNLRVFTTTDETPWRIYTLWHDHQYRNAMFWQMCGYNQTPHPSFFLGEKEGITSAPPAVTMTGRTEVSNGATIGASQDDKQIIMAETNDMTVTVASGAKPYIFFDNAPTWVQGHNDNDNITTTTYTHTLKGAAFTGDMRLVKQGDGILVLPNVEQTYTGNTDVWAGTLKFDGTLKNSRLWLNRHTTLITDGGKFEKGILADYGSTIIPGGKDKAGSLSTDSLNMNFGSRLLLDLYTDGSTSDVVTANVLKIENKDWVNGPTYLAPVIQINAHLKNGETQLAAGEYFLANIGKMEGDLADVIIEGLPGQKSSLELKDGKLYVNVLGTREANSVSWTGSVDGNWNLAETENFELGQGKDIFVTGDKVTFDDNATNFNVNVVGNLVPSSVLFNNTKTYTLSGDAISGNPTLTKNSSGIVNINNQNNFGSTFINDGTLVVTSLANDAGVDCGSLGDINQVITLSGGATLSASTSVTGGQPIKIADYATINAPKGVTIKLNQGVTQLNSKASLTKTGEGSLNLASQNTFERLILKEGNLNATEYNNMTALPDTVEFRGGTLLDPNSQNSYTKNYANFMVPEGETGSFYMDPRCEYYGKLLGAGTFNVYAAGARNFLQGDWSEFTGTVVPKLKTRGSFAAEFHFKNSYGLPKATMQLDIAVANDGKDFPVGKVLGTGTLNGAGKYLLMSDDDYTFAAATSASTPLVKCGTGKMTISKLGNIKGSLEVRDGILRFNNATVNTLVAGGTLAITENGQVVARGLANELTMSGKAQLTPVNYLSSSVVGKFKVNNACTISDEAAINFYLTGANSCSQLLVGKDLTYNGVVNVVLNSSYTPSAGDSFTLWEAVSFTGTPKVVLPELPAGLAWDTSALLAGTGVLKITSATGISHIKSDATCKAQVFTTSGYMFAELGSVVKSKIAAVLKEMGAQNGVYIVRLRSDEKEETVKVIVK